LTAASAAPAAVGIDALVERYAALLLDAYGTLVSTTGALPGAIALVERLERTGKPYLVLTNDAAKLPGTAAARYRAFGLPLRSERILGSGLLLDAHFAAHGLAGARCAVLGPADADDHVRRAGGDVVPISAAFDVLVVADQSGFDFLPGMDAALSSLFAAIDAGRPLHVVVPNPDLLYPAAPGRFGFAAGTMALMLEAALARRYPHRPASAFVRLGKPHAPMFEAAVARLGTRDAVMIGDQLETDIRGAAEYGLDTALVRGGVSIVSEAGERTTDAAPGNGACVPRPTYLLRSLL
jgi:ribonucleotide monophosphatase NagD (HAD superfamily)